MTTTPDSTHAQTHEERGAAFMQRMFGSLITTMETQSAYLGLRLGYYTALQKIGPLDANGLALATSTDPRYAREWLEQQAVAGFLTLERQHDDPQKRRYALPEAHAEVLTDPDSLNFLGFIPVMTASFGAMLGSLVQAYRTGSGVPWESYGQDMREAQGNQNRAFLKHFLVPVVLPALTDVDRRLRTTAGARVADFACGVGWASIALAQQYPGVTVDGFDLDVEAIADGQRAVHEAGLGERVKLDARNIGDPNLAGRYDLVVMVEALHDLSHPVKVLEQARRLLTPGGCVLVVDENTMDEFSAPGNETERAFYGFSVLACLANGRVEPDSAMTGTAMRPATVRRYASEAGFSSVEILAVQHDFFRFYKLVP